MRVGNGALSAIPETIGDPRGRLEAVVAMWPPPAARDFKGANSADHVRDATGKAHLGQLPNFVEHLWSTPRSSDAEKGGPNQAFGAGGTPLPAQATQWYAPNVPNGGRSLAEDTSPTGMTADGAKRQVGLENQARQWATPTSLNFDKSHQPGNSRSQNQNMELARGLYSRLARATVKTGVTSSKERRSLNPLFVEWLMGWPPGWTLLAWIDFACSATELSRYRQRMRCALFANASPPPAPPVQVDLLG